MPQRDIYHESVRNALTQDGWVITHDPFVLAFGQRTLYADLGAEAPLAAEKGGRRIAVEIKSFVGQSEVTELERALGQYALYGFLLLRVEPDRDLFLAVTDQAYQSVFGTAEGQDLIRAEHLKLIVFNAAREVIVRWIE